MKDRLDVRVLLLGAVTALGCSAPPDAEEATYGETAEAITVPSPIAHEQHKLVFQDTFNSLDLSPDGYGNHKWFNNVAGWPSAPPSWFRTENSVLNLRWFYSTQVFATSVASASAFSSGHRWTHGYFEARMKWNVKPGAWPAFWLLDEKWLSAPNTYPPRCEIDIFEGQAAHPHMFYGTVHAWTPENHMNPNNAHHVKVDYEHFHVYGLHWTAHRISWYLDNKLLISYPTPGICKNARMFAILGAQEGVGWDYTNLTGVAADTELYLDVDWIRVWQKK